MNTLSLYTKGERTERAPSRRDDNSSISILKSVQIEIMRKIPAVWDPNWAIKVCFMCLGILYLHCWGGLYLILVSGLLLESAPVLRTHYYTIVFPSLQEVDLLQRQKDLFNNGQIWNHFTSFILSWSCSQFQSKSQPIPKILTTCLLAALLCHVSELHWSWIYYFTDFFW